MRNRKHLKLPAIADTIINDENDNAVDSLDALPIEILWHIFAYCEYKSKLNLSRVNKIFFSIAVLDNPRNMKLMDLYKEQCDLFRKNNPREIIPLLLVSSYINSLYSDFVIALQYGIPKLIDGLEKNSSSQASHLKLLNFIYILSDINKDFASYQKKFCSHGPETDELLQKTLLGAGLVFVGLFILLQESYLLGMVGGIWVIHTSRPLSFQKNVLKAAGLMLSCAGISFYLDHLLPVMFGALVVMASFMKMLFDIHLDEVAQDEEKKRLQKRLLQHFSMFDAGNKKPGLLMSEVLQNRSPKR